GYMKALLAERGDLSGLPFAMGDSCRTKGERSRQFAIAVNTVRQAQSPAPVPVQVAPATFSGTTPGLQLPPPVDPGSQVPPPPSQPAPTAPPTGGPGPQAPQPPQAAQPGQPTPQVVTGGTALSFEVVDFAPANAGPTEAAAFWQRYVAAVAQEDATLAASDRALREHITVCRVAALMQVLAPESPSVRLGLVKYLAGVSHPEATRALARLAVFSQEDEVRLAAVEALKV